MAACAGQAVLVERRTAAGTVAGGALGGTTSKHSGPALSKGGSKSLNLGKVGGSSGAGGSAASGGGAGSAAAVNGICATNSNPAQGFTDKSLRIGTIIPLTGALRPLGQQVERVLKVTVDATMNRQTHIPGYKINWGCGSRPGIFGRKVSVDVFSLQSNTPEEVLAGMRRLIDVDHDFLVRDCYLESNLMGSAVQYENSKSVPTVWCYYANSPLPALLPWNYAPGVDPNVIAAIHIAYMIKHDNVQHLAMLADPSIKSNIVPVVKAVAKHFGHPIPDKCIVYKKAQDASNGESAEVTALRTCYGGATETDGVYVGDALNGTFAPLDANDQNWHPQWACQTCWVQTLASLCGNACQSMETDCQALPCIPWADPKQYPAAAALNKTYQKYLSQEPPDVLTYGPAAITGGIALWLAMTGPNLSQAAFRHTVENLHHWDAGIGPILDTSPSDHFGGRSAWLIHFTGSKPWFDDITGGFVTLKQMGIPENLVP
jgi:hypothetical protein